MTIIYHEEDGDLNYLTGRNVGVIGYGNLGRPMALNLRDSGLQVVVGVRADEQAAVLADSLPTADIATTAQNANILFLLLPDEVMPEIYLEHISPFLRSGCTLIFASAYNVAFGFIEAPPFVDVGLIAPRTIGADVRERYRSETGFFSFVAVGQDASGHAWDTVLALAKAVGTLKAGAIEVNIEQEAELDLFIQQAILPAFYHVIVTAANLLIRMGYPPEAALADLYISGEFTDYMHRAANIGLLHTLRLTSLTGQYGAVSRQDRFNDLKLERLMEVTLEEIRDGSFAQEWSKEYADGYPRLRKQLRLQEAMDLWEMEQQALDFLRRY